MPAHSNSQHQRHIHDMIDFLHFYPSYPFFNPFFNPFYPFVSFLIISCQFSCLETNFSMVRFGIADLSSRRPLPIGLWVLHWCLPANVHLQRDHLQDVGWSCGILMDSVQEFSALESLELNTRFLEKRGTRQTFWIEYRSLWRYTLDGKGMI